MATALCGGLLWAEEEWYPEWQPIDEVTVRSDDGRMALKVKIQRFERDQLSIKEIEKGHEVHAGKERLPQDVVYYQPCLVRGFELSINGKKVEVPERLWKDVAGFSLSKLQKLPKKPTENQKMMYQMGLEDPMLMPQIRQSDIDDNYMIIWSRGADCDQRHTVRWIISKDGKMIMRHLDIPPHHC